MEHKQQHVSVAFATEQQQFHITVDFMNGMTALDAIHKSGIAEQVALPEPLQLGIFGSKIDVDTVLNAGYSGGAVKMASFDAGKPGCDSGIVSKPSMRSTMPFPSK